MSPRAASRLESIDFEQVSDYSAGKADRGSFRLPLDGDADRAPASAPPPHRCPDLPARGSTAGTLPAPQPERLGDLLRRQGRDRARSDQAHASTPSPNGCSDKT